MSPLIRLLSGSSSTMSSAFPSRSASLNASSYRMHLTRDREKAENALFEHVRKAVNSQETAPKQKHVRGKIRLRGITFYYL